VLLCIPILFYVTILSTTQVTLKRVIVSKLKIIKGKIGLNISQNILASFMSIPIEKDVAESMNSITITNEISN
jgi:hypothetical protein